MKNMLVIIFALLIALPLAAQDNEEKKPTPPAAPEEAGISTEHIEVAVKALSSRFDEERKAARKTLIRAGKKAVPALLTHLESDTPSQRAAAAEILGHIGSIEAAPKLAGLFKDKDLSVRDTAKNALARIGPDAVKYLQKLLEGSEADKEYFKLTVDKMVVNCIRNLVVRGTGGEEEYGDYPGQFDEIRKIGKHAIAPLIELAKKSERYSDQYLAVIALGRLGDKSAIPALKEMFDEEMKLPEEDRRLYDDAAIALWQLGNDSALKKVEEQYRLAMIKEPGNYLLPSNLALLYHKMEKWDKAEEFYKKAIEVAPDNTGAYYNFACLLAVRNRLEEAMTMLTKSVENGYASGAWLMRDGELKNLHELPAFKKLVEKHYGKAPGAE